MATSIERSARNYNHPFVWDVVEIPKKGPRVFLAENITREAAELLVSASDVPMIAGLKRENEELRRVLVLLGDTFPIHLISEGRTGEVLRRVFAGLPLF